MKPRCTLLLSAIAGAAYLVGRRQADRPEPVAAGHPALPTGSSTGKPAGATGPLSVPGPRRPPGADADAPTQIPAAGWRQILRRSWQEQKDDNVGLLAAGVAFYAFTALFPALIAAVTVYGLVADPQQVTEQVNSLADNLPAEVATLLQNQLTSITSGSHQALGIGLAVSVLGALFSASGGVGNLLKAINVAYDEDEERGFVKVRSLALLLTLGAVLFLVVAVALIAVLPVVLQHVGLGAAGSALVFVLRWGGLIGFMLVALAVLYRVGPDRDAPKFRWVGLGAAVATVLWIVGSAGFSLYISNFGSYGKTYGALAGVVVLLLWLYLTSFIVLLGAEINSESEKQTARDSTRGEPLPMGERRAEKADTLAGG